MAVSLFTFGANLDTPKDAYLLQLDGDRAFRYIPLKFTSVGKMEEFLAKDAEDRAFVTIPGYNILLAFQRFDPLHNQFIAVNASEAAADYTRVSWYNAVRFYISHKINPNVEKFRRYKAGITEEEARELPERHLRVGRTVEETERLRNRDW